MHRARLLRALNDGHGGVNGDVRAVCASVAGAEGQAPAQGRREEAREGRKQVEQTFGITSERVRAIAYYFASRIIHSRRAAMCRADSAGGSLRVLHWSRFRNPFRGSRLLPGIRAFSVFLLVLASAAASRRRNAAVQAAPVPVKCATASSRSQSTISGLTWRTPLQTTNLSASTRRVPSDISITAADPHFWDSGVDIEPWRLGMRPTHPAGEPQTIRFRLTGSGQAFHLAAGRLPESGADAVSLCRLAATAAAERAQRHHRASGRAPREPESQKRRDDLS